MLHLILMLLIAAIIGVIGDALVKDSMPGGLIGSMIAGIAGSWLGTLILGDWGPDIAGFALIPAILGAALFVFLIGTTSRMFRHA